MTINIVKPFKSQTARTFDKSKIGQDVHAGERFPSADISLYSVKKIFKFGTATAVGDDNLSEPKPLEHVKAVQSSSLFDACADIRVEKQKKILSKVRLAKNNITKLFKPTGRASAAVPCIDPFAIPSVEHGTSNDRSSSLSSLSIVQHTKPEARVVAAYESTPPQHTNSEAISSPIACGENEVDEHTKPEARVVAAYDSTPPQHTNSEAISSPIACGENEVDEHIEDLATFCNSAEASSPLSTGQLFATPESQLGMLPSTFFLGELHTIEEEDGSTEVVVGLMYTEQKELGTSGSYMSRSNSDSEVTSYFSSDTLSDHSTTHGVGLVSSETSTSPVNTSFATSVDAEVTHQSLPGALRELRRVPNYEDLRNLQTIANRDFPCSDLSCGSSDCEFSYGAASGINTAPLRRLRKCNDLRKSFLSLEPEMCTPSNKYRKFRAWLSTRCQESSRNTQKTSGSRAPSETLKATPVSRSRQFLQDIFHPSSRVQAHVSKPSPHQPSLPSSPPVWSCAKITRSSSKAKRRRRMTKQSMKELKARLDSMDIDPWY